MQNGGTNKKGKKIGLIGIAVFIVAAAVFIIANPGGGNVGWVPGAITQGRMFLYPASLPHGNTEIHAGAEIFGSGVRITSSEPFTFMLYSPQDALYQLTITYQAMPGRSNPMELDIYINNKNPYADRGSIILPRLWRNETEIQIDPRGNDIRPMQMQYEIMNTKTVTYNADGGTVLLFPLVAGYNEIMLTAATEALDVFYMTFGVPIRPPLYFEYALYHRHLPRGTHSVRLQGESADIKTDSVLAPGADLTSLYTDPIRPGNVTLNIIGDTWFRPGQSLTWVLYKEEAGLYQLNMRLRQNEARGLVASRTLLINGEVPFEEVRNMRFTYSNAWNIFTPGGNEPFLFALNQGRNTITLVNVLGDMAEILDQAHDISNRLRYLYTDIVMITGGSPDVLRDYALERQIPGLLDSFYNLANDLDNVVRQVNALNMTAGGDLVPLERLARQMREFIVRPWQITERLIQFQGNISALELWRQRVSERPLQLDFLEFVPPGTTPPPAEPGFFRALMFSVRRFIVSFTLDYTDFTNPDGDEDRSILVWIATGRDQAQLINEMARTQFTPHSNIRVDLQLVEPGIILPAVASGDGPDVWISAPFNIPVDYASRNAAFDLTQFADIDKIKSRFFPASLDAFRFEGGLYALPEQNSTQILFYRTDIMNRLGLDVPQTWDDVIAMIPVLSINNMQFLLDGATGAAETLLSIFLFQNGGEFYRYGGKLSALDEEVALQSFSQLTRFFTHFGMPVTFNAFQRFRTGESPILVANLAMYNLLSLGAPELRSRWRMHVIPGTMQPDGTINRSSRSEQNALVMMRNATDPGAAWEFMKWFTDADTQVKYVQGLESLMGAAARINPANREAMARIAWTQQEFDVIYESLHWARAIPETPGGYYNTRHVNNAFRAVTVEGTNFRETMLDFVRRINIELYQKRTEFGLPAIDPRR